MTLERTHTYADVHAIFVRARARFEDVARKKNSTSNVLRMWINLNLDLTLYFVLVLTIGKILIKLERRDYIGMEMDVRRKRSEVAYQRRGPATWPKRARESVSSVYFASVVTLIFSRGKRESLFSLTYPGDRST